MVFTWYGQKETEMIYLLGSIFIWLLVMEMNSSQDAIWSDYVKDKKDNDKLHSFDAVAIAALGVLLAYGYKGFDLESLRLALFFFLARAAYFSWRMNLKRIKRGIKITWHHLGSNWWDNIFKGNEKLYFIVGLTGMLATIYWLIFPYV